MSRKSVAWISLSWNILVWLPRKFATLNFASLNFQESSLILQRNILRKFDTFSWKICENIGWNFLNFVYITFAQSVYYIILLHFSIDFKLFKLFFTVKNWFILILYFFIWTWKWYNIWYAILVLKYVLHGGWEMDWLLGNLSKYWDSFIDWFLQALSPCKECQEYCFLLKWEL